MVVTVTSKLSTSSTSGALFMTPPISILGWCVSIHSVEKGEIGNMANQGGIKNEMAIDGEGYSVLLVADTNHWDTVCQ